MPWAHRARGFFRLLASELLLIALAAGVLAYGISLGGSAALRSLAPPELVLLASGGPGRPGSTPTGYRLAALQVAFSKLLLVSAGLLARTYRTVREADLGSSRRAG